MDSFAMGEHVWAQQVVGAVAQLLVIAKLGRGVCNDRRVRAAREDFSQPVPKRMAEVGEDYVRQEQATLGRVFMVPLAAP